MNIRLDADAIGLLRPRTIPLAALVCESHNVHVHNNGWTFRRLASIVAITVAAAMMTAGSVSPTFIAAASSKEVKLPIIEPEELVTWRESSGPLPWIYQVGVHSLYLKGHIPGDGYIGPASTKAGLKALRQIFEHMPRNTRIVLYCGCCPWQYCPNVRPAYTQLRAMGFSDVKVLHLAQSFTVNWIEKGYPTAKGNTSN